LACVSRALKTKYSKAAFCCACLFLLSSCAEILTYKTVTAGLYAASQGYFSSPDVNLSEKNYAAADFLASQINEDVSFSDQILVQPLQEVDHVGISSPFGVSISEGVGLRLIELGYKVLLHDVASGANTGLYPAPKALHPHYTLGGRYAVNKDDVDVFLRIVSVHTGKVVGYFDYTMPLSKEFEALSKTETRIFKVQ